jgi:hypothetical protein
MKYQMLVKIEFHEMDDIAAREKAMGILENPVKYFPDRCDQIKLQRVFPDKAPEGVKFEGWEKLIEEGE